MKKRLAVVILVMLMLASGIVYAQSSENATSLDSLYNSMKSQLEENNFEIAYEFAQQMEGTPGGMYYKDSSLYICYLSGWKAMQNEEIDEAIDYFGSIVSAGFLNSEGYLEYLMGRRDQNNEDYETAIEHYDRASALGITLGVTKRAECKKAKQEKDYTTAMKYFKLGRYDKSAEAFEKLGAFSDSKKYWKESIYLYAKQTADRQEYEQAIGIMLQVVPYEDSEELISRWELAKEERIIEISVKKLDVQSLEVSWTDKLDLGIYTVAYYPGNMDSLIKQKTITGMNTVLDDLIPSTEYTIIVASTKNGIAHSETKFTTDIAPKHTDLKLITSSQSYNPLYSFNLQDRYLYDNIRAFRNSNKAKQATSMVINLPSRSMTESGTGYMYLQVVQIPDTGKNQELNSICVLRIGNTYLAYEENVITVSEGDGRFQDFIFELTQLFDQIYAQANGWPDTNANVDIYIDGKLLCQSSFTLLPETKR